MTFLTDGRVLRGLPAQGPAKGAGSGVADYGTYELSGGSAFIVWSGGDQIRVDFDASSRFTMYGATYTPLDALTGARLEGRYARASGGSGRSITFMNDGTFEDDGFGSDTGLLSTSFPSGSGNYEIENNTLSLHYEDGPELSLAVYALPQDVDSLDELVLGGFVFRSS